MAVIMYLQTLSTEMQLRYQGFKVSEASIYEFRFNKQSYLYVFALVVAGHLAVI